MIKCSLEEKQFVHIFAEIGIREKSNSIYVTTNIHFVLFFFFSFLFSLNFLTKRMVGGAEKNKREINFSLRENTTTTTAYFCGLRVGGCSSLDMRNFVRMFSFPYLPTTYNTSGLSTSKFDKLFSLSFQI